VAQQILEPDDHRRLEAHAERLVDDVQDADAAAVGERLHLDEALGVDREMAGAPAFEAVMFLGLGGRPGGCGFAFQREWKGGVMACFWRIREFVRCLFHFSKLLNTQ
jgi:hypothetical protein